jgi:DNA-binding PadR family transcriptional regulator
LSDTTTSVGAPAFTAFQRTIFVILSEEAHDRVAIKCALDTYDATAVTRERLSPTLDRLVERGFVEQRKRDRRTNEDALTEAGHDASVTRLSWDCSRVGTTASRAAERHDHVAAAQ